MSNPDFPGPYWQGEPERPNGSAGYRNGDDGDDQSPDGWPGEWTRGYSATPSNGAATPSNGAANGRRGRREQRHNGGRSARRASGYDAAGYDPAGYDAAGYDAAGYDHAGYDAAGRRGNGYRVADTGYGGADPGYGGADTGMVPRTPVMAATAAGRIVTATALTNTAHGDLGTAAPAWPQMT